MNALTRNPFISDAGDHPRRTTLSVPRRSVETPNRSTAINARALIPNGQTATIDLDGQSYVLRITRAGKLILTK